MEGWYNVQCRRHHRKQTTTKTNKQFSNIDDNDKRRPSDARIWVNDDETETLPMI